MTVHSEFYELLHKYGRTRIKELKSSMP